MEADFVALDLEFTGIELTNQTRYSFFDTAAERYAKVRDSLAKTTVFQFGLACFCKTASGNSLGVENKWQAHVYNIALFPPSLAALDISFLCQASALQFLTEHDMDITAIVKNGVSFMTDDQEDTVRVALMDGRYRHHFQEKQERELQLRCLRVAEWIETKQEVNEAVPHCDVLPILGVPSYALQCELRARFEDIWTYSTNDGLVVVYCVSKEKRMELENQEQLESEPCHFQYGSACLPRNESNMFIEELLGFTRVFRLLVNLKKPLVGHNCYMDLLMMFDKFYHCLPEDYDAFKNELHNLFPLVFDTKYLCYQMQSSMRETHLLDRTGLRDLYLALTGFAVTPVLMNSIKDIADVTEVGTTVDANYVFPQIIFEDGLETESYMIGKCAHEAGCDAFMTGVVLLRLAHILATQDCSGLSNYRLNFFLYKNALNKHANYINLIKANIHSINLAHQDPRTSRPPPVLITKSVNVHNSIDNNINLQDVANQVAIFGLAHVRKLDSRKVLVVMSTYNGMRALLRGMCDNKDYDICIFQPLRHQYWLRVGVWLGTVISTSISIVALRSVWRR